MVWRPVFYGLRLCCAGLSADVTVWQPRLHVLHPPPHPLHPPDLDWRTTERAARKTSAATSRPTIHVDISITSFLVYLLISAYHSARPQASRFRTGMQRRKPAGCCSGQPRAHEITGIPGRVYPWGFPRDKKGYLYHNRRCGGYDHISIKTTVLIEGTHRVIRGCVQRFEKFRFTKLFKALVSKRTHMSRVLMRCSGIAAAPLLECARRAQGWVGLVGGKALAELAALREHCLVRRFMRHQALIGVDIGVRVVCALYPVAHPLAVAPAV